MACLLDTVRAHPDGCFGWDLYLSRITGMGLHLKLEFKSEARY